MKIRHIAGAVLAALSSQAFALSPSVIADNSTVKVYVSGASALRNVIGAIFTNNCSGDLTVYWNGASFQSSGAAAQFGAGAAHRVYACTFKSDAPIESLRGQKVAMFKSDIGGSGQGVFPVQAEVARPFLALTNCVAAAANSGRNFDCSTEQTQVPMAGVSDVEPALFVGPNVPKLTNGDPEYSELTVDQIAELDSQPLFQTIFGMAVSRKLRNAMQAAQGLPVNSDVEADQPSMPRLFAASVLSGNLQSPADGLGWQALVGKNAADAASRVNVCRRVDGSGTQAAANMYFNQFPCGTNPLTIADKSVNGSLSAPGKTGSFYVSEGSSTGNVTQCLNAANAADAFAIGHVSVENAPGASDNWRHVKIDGIYPSRDNAKTGKYDYVVESTMQWKTSVFETLTPAQQAFLSEFRAVAGTADMLATLGTPSQGVAALPLSYAAAFGEGTPNEIAFGSRVSRGGNSCNAPIFYK